ncbi:glycerophosphoryl diester phosphodiesterase membrane domain-containing protein [Herbiconiux sp. VKM Ac-1786]|uniref:glycerophosphoryl diester phosphodiesterase membrane domain-containing protein n=1 Tax=Herbiconiux sp. VKM Ac-1786 TaxID=2783824 RepID=UPI00188AC315|nr:glycerophosphoryl diester phosphodiesterase membrane domain-containing protein [Herbiconiux sp. VKM Ac-1786]MBF4574410.1 glycerophosphoryl diester phosphodiesterase membrane domain-containing protein [Herbiconiux sp. VKM Ac-1786]
MSDGGSWAAPGAEPGERPDARADEPVTPPPAAPSPVPPMPQYGQYAPPPPPQQYGQPAPQYGQYAPPLPPQQQQQPAWQQQPPAWQYAAPPAGYTAPPQWAPPPKPGLIPLRPLGFGTLLGAPFQAVRRNPKATFGSGLLVQLVIVLVTGVFVGVAVFWAISRSVSAEGQADADAVAAGSVGIVLVSLVVPLLLSLFASALLQAVLVLEVARATLGEKRRLGELWKAAFTRTLPLAGWFALTAAAVIVVIAILVGIVLLANLLGGEGGLVAGILVTVLLGIALIVPAAWLSTKLALVPSVIVLERAGLVQAVRRSWSLTNGNFWRTLGVIWLVSIILSAAGQIIQAPFSFLLPIVMTVIDPNNTGSGIVALIVLYIVFLALSLLLGAVTSVVQAATVAVVYLDLRMRKEGLDIELQRFVESRQDGLDSWPDPYATAGYPAQARPAEPRA